MLTIDFKSVHIQAFGFPEKPGIVAFANLSDPNVEDTLRKHRAYRNVPAMRMPSNGWLTGGGLLL